MKHILITAVLGITSLPAIQACNVPVFRYALERWQTDSCDAVVFHDGPLSTEQQAEFQELEKQTQRAHAKAISEDIRNVKDDSLASLWQQLQDHPEVTLPYVVIRTTVAGRNINSWRGPLASVSDAQVMTSPVREELGRRLLSGHAVVWLILKGQDADQNEDFSKRLNDQLQQLGSQIPIPDGIGLPGSELFADIPLLMKFSALEVDPQDPQERFLTELLRSFAADAEKQKSPLVVPVFGRARALEVFPATDLNSDMIEDLTMYLCGACSCQVKERNPGFDLLTSVHWETELFGDNAQQIRRQIQPPASAKPPALLTIPPGAKTLKR